jgi:uncharacterized membrane protein HdeD (DUF308 family)
VPDGRNLQGHDGKPLSGLVMMIPGIVFIALGVLIIVWPPVLPWLVAAACILAGGAMLVMATFMRRVGASFRHASG